jgi:hypothetical protein
MMPVLIEEPPWTTQTAPKKTLRKPPKSSSVGLSVEGFGRLRFLRTELPIILAQRTDVLSARMMRIIEDLAGDWCRLDERIEGLSAEITGGSDRAC